MTTPWLLTGVTGGLGAKILDDMLYKHAYAPQSIIATSRSEKNRSRFEAQGVQFRRADYDDLPSLLTAFEGVENLLFMSSSEGDTVKRNREHDNVVKAAQAAGVKKVWYVSLAFGGFEDTSKISFQDAHVMTENQLMASGLDFVSLRAGVYSDAFPLFLNWYPCSTSVRLPVTTPLSTESKVAFTTRAELGEAMATLFVRGLAAFPTIQPRTKKNIILLTSQRLESLDSLVGAIDHARKGSRSPLPIEHVEADKWLEESERDDVGRKPRVVFDVVLSFVRGICAGDASVTDSALATLLGRKPEFGTQAVERLVRENPGYIWHQNHA